MDTSRAVTAALQSLHEKILKLESEKTCLYENIDNLKKSQQELENLLQKERWFSQTKVQELEAFVAALTKENAVLRMEVHDFLSVAKRSVSDKVENDLINLKHSSQENSTKVENLELFTKEILKSIQATNIAQQIQQQQLKYNSNNSCSSPSLPFVETTGGGNASFEKPLAASEKQQLETTVSDLLKLSTTLASQLATSSSASTSPEMQYAAKCKKNENNANNSIGKPIAFSKPQYQKRTSSSRQFHEERHTSVAVNEVNCMRSRDLNCCTQRSRSPTASFSLKTRQPDDEPPRRPMAELTNNVHDRFRKANNGKNPPFVTGSAIPSWNAVAVTQKCINMRYPEETGAADHQHCHSSRKNTDPRAIIEDLCTQVESEYFALKDDYVKLMEREAPSSSSYSSSDVSESLELLLSRMNDKEQHLQKLRVLLMTTNHSLPSRAPSPTIAHGMEKRMKTLKLFSDLRTLQQ